MRPYFQHEHKNKNIFNIQTLISTYSLKQVSHYFYIEGTKKFLIVHADHINLIKWKLAKFLSVELSFQIKRT